MRTIRNLFILFVLLLLAVPGMASAAPRIQARATVPSWGQAFAAMILHLRASIEGWAGPSLSQEKSRGTMDPDGLLLDSVDPGNDSRGTMDPNG